MRNSSRVSPAAHWASWAECPHCPCVPFLATRSRQRCHGASLASMQAAMRCREFLLDMGVEGPPWEDLIRGAVPRNDLDDAEPGGEARWQFQATQKVEDCCLRRAMWPRLPGPSRALLRSQGGSMAGLPFTSPHSRFDTAVPCSPLPSSLASFALFRSQRPPPCSLRSGRGSGRRGFMVESAAAQVCRGRRQSFVRASKTWIWLGRTCWTTVNWRLWRTTCHCSMERSLQLTALWCATGPHTHVAQTWTELLCRRRVGGRRPFVPRWVARSAGRGWSCCVRSAGGQTNASVSCASWPGPRSTLSPCT